MISGSTQVLGVIGDPVAHTSSPAMHNGALEVLGLDYVYVAWHVEAAGLPAAIAGMRALEIAGLNVTVPHKQAVCELVDELAEEARAIGAVNTIVRRDGGLIGHNTDAFGVLECLRRDAGLERLPARVAVLGAGGSARAVLYALLRQPEVERIELLNRTVGRAEALAADLGGGSRVAVARLDRDSRRPIQGSDLLINCTSVGMHPHPDASPLPQTECLRAGMVVLDIVYNPLRTRLMRQAETAGARALNGLGMLAYQGARSFELWTGQWPPVEAMLAAARARLPAPN